VSSTRSVGMSLARRFNAGVPARADGVGVVAPDQIMAVPVRSDG